MAARLTDKQKKKILADYLETQSVNAAARRNNVSWDTARKALHELGDIEQKLEEKKAENTADILAYMESKRDRVCDILETGLSVLPEKIANAKTASEVTTAMGTLIDKWLGAANSGRALQAEDDKLTQSLEEMGRVLKSDDQS